MASTESFVLVIILYFLLIYVAYKYRLSLEPPKFDQLRYIALLERITKCLRSHRKSISGIEINQIGGFGNDGRVYIGRACIPPSNRKDGTNEHPYFPSPLPCAFKRSHPIQKHILITLQEAERLIDVNHKNIIYCYGVASIDSYPMLVLPYQNGGSFKDYFNNLREKKLQANGQIVTEIRIGNIIYALKSVANAVEYLHNSNYLHRDIAARNVLIDFVDKPEGQKNQVLSEQCCNIVLCDMALSCKQDDVTKINDDLEFPVRWLAPEILQPYLNGKNQKDRKNSTCHNWVYTTAADVWSFGCFGWEILHLCKYIPHQNCLNSDQIYHELLKPDRGLPLPQETPDSLHKLIRDCLELTPGSRPSFTDIVMRLNEMEGNTEEMNIKLNTGITGIGPPPQLQESTADYRPRCTVSSSPPAGDVCNVFTVDINIS